MARYVRNAAQPATPAGSPSSTTRAQRVRAAAAEEQNRSPAQPRAGQQDAPPPYAEFGKRVSEHAQQMLDEELSQRFGRGALELGRFADALRSAGARLEGSRTGPYIDSAAGQIERAAQLLRNANARELVDGVERFARQSPLAFIGGALAVGIGAGRFLKSSAQGAGLPVLPSDTRAPLVTTPPRQATRRNNQQASQTRGNEP